MRSQLGIVSIYALICPLDGYIKYIGSSIDPEQRLVGHLSNKGNQSKYDWLQLLLNREVMPILLILDECENCDRVFVETYYIEKHKPVFNKRKPLPSMINHKKRRRREIEGFVDQLYIVSYTGRINNIN